MKCIYICDFNDSFTYNIYSTLKNLNPELNIKVINQDRVLSFLQVLNQSDEKCCVVLGPGPGHPDDYAYLFGTVQRLIENPNIFLMGICLGHQLIWSCLGFHIKHCGTPVHGQTSKYMISSEIQKKLGLDKSIEVQRYNSLAVILSHKEIETVKLNDWSLLLDQNELILSLKDDILSYQFHPESIGTEKPGQFFEPLLKACV